MTDLHDKARALLALRDKATPGPWIYVRRDEWGHSVATQHGEIPDGSPNYWTVASINKNREPEHEANARLIASAHDMADLIRDQDAKIAALLAENERLTHALAAQVAATNGASAYAVEQANRAEAAEARLKALCEAEPVVWMQTDRMDTEFSKLQLARADKVAGWSEIPLIPRPSMEGKP